MKRFIYDPEKRFLRLNVYKFPLGNCGGITDTLGRQDIFIPHPQGPTRYEDIDDDNLIFEPEQRADHYFALIPVVKKPGMVGPMAGGNLAYTSDSRCKVVYHIHDRWETQEQYNTLST